jgi:hypothetical protein
MRIVISIYIPRPHQSKHESQATISNRKKRKTCKYHRLQGGVLLQHEIHFSHKASKQKACLLACLPPSLLTDRQDEEHVGDHSNSSKQLCFPPLLNLSLIPSSSHSKASPKHPKKKKKKKTKTEKTW